MGVHSEITLLDPHRLLLLWWVAANFDSGAVTTLRCFLQLERNADIVYYIDNLRIEKLSD